VGWDQLSSPSVSLGTARELMEYLMQRNGMKQPPVLLQVTCTILVFNTTDEHFIPSLQNNETRETGVFTGFCY